MNASLQRSGVPRDTITNSALESQSPWNLCLGLARAHLGVLINCWMLSSLTAHALGKADFV